MSQTKLFARRGLLTATIWAVAIMLFGPMRSPAAVVLLAATGWGVQHVCTHHVGPWRRFSGTVTFQASQVWIGAALAAIAALLMGRLIPAAVGLEIVVAAAMSAAVLAIAQHVSAAAQSVAQPTRAVIVGTGEEAAEWVALLQDHPETGVKIVGCIGDVKLARRVGLEKLWLGDVASLVSLLQEHEIDMPIVSVTSFRRPALQAIVDALLAENIDVAMSWGVGRLSTRRLETTLMSNETLPIIRAQKPRAIAPTVKRLVDVTVSASLLVLSAPFILLAAILVRLDSSGPSFYRQVRVGQNERPFRMIKLRTMEVDADQELDRLQAGNQRQGPLFKMSRDPRVTRMGRFLRATSMDEIPQLVNVLRGDMSLVGPRPALFEEFAAFDDQLASRISVRPGLTGLWQVEARSNESFGAYRRLDLHYLENWSLWLDLRIMLATAHVLVLGAVLSPVTSRLAGQRRSAIDSPKLVPVDARPAAIGGLGRQKPNLSEAS